MSCRDFEARLHAYIDGELDTAGRQEVESHLEGCDDCRSELEDWRRLRQTLQDPALRYAASDTLRQRIQNELSKAGAPRRTFRPLAIWTGAAMAAVFVALVTWSVLPQFHGEGDEDDAMADAAIEQHAESLEQRHLTDIVSADPAAVQSWFKGKLPFEPPVPDLNARGYTLVGARVDKVEEHPAAALVYLHHADYVTVFVCEADKPGVTDVDADEDDGYHITYWNKGSLSFWVVAKLPPEELKQLGEHLHDTL